MKQQTLDQLFSKNNRKNRQKNNPDEQKNNQNDNNANQHMNMNKEKSDAGKSSKSKKSEKLKVQQKPMLKTKQIQKEDKVSPAKIVKKTIVKGKLTQIVSNQVTNVKIKPTINKSLKKTVVDVSLYKKSKNLPKQAVILPIKKPKAKKSKKKPSKLQPPVQIVDLASIQEQKQNAIKLRQERIQKRANLVKEVIQDSNQKESEENDENVQNQKENIDQVQQPCQKSIEKNQNNSRKKGLSRRVQQKIDQAKQGDSQKLYLNDSLQKGNAPSFSIIIPNNQKFVKKSGRNSLNKITEQKSVEFVQQLKKPAQQNQQIKQNIQSEYNQNPFSDQNLINAADKWGKTQQIGKNKGADGKTNNKAENKGVKKGRANLKSKRGKKNSSNEQIKQQFNGQYCEQIDRQNDLNIKSDLQTIKNQNFMEEVITPLIKKRKIIKKPITVVASCKKSVLTASILLNYQKISSQTQDSDFILTNKPLIFSKFTQPQQYENIVKEIKSFQGSK